MLRFVYAVLLLGLAVITAAQSTNVTVPADDSRIQYTGNWTDQGNGQHKFASASGSGLTFVFQGTAFYYHSTINPNGGLAQMWVDNDSPQDVDQSAHATVGAQPIQAVIFSKEGLNQAQNHTFNLQYVGAGAEGGGYVEIYSLAYTITNGTASSTSTPSATSASSNTSNGSSHKSHAGAIVGGVVGGVLALLVGGAIIFWLGRRSSKADERTKATDGPLSAAPYAVPVEESSPTTKSAASYSSPSAVTGAESLDYMRSIGSSIGVTSPLPGPSIHTSNPASTATQSMFGHSTHGALSTSGISEPPPQYEPSSR